MKLTVKVEPLTNVSKDIKKILKSGQFEKLIPVKDLEDDYKWLLLDLSYSTILGYSKDSLYKTFAVLTENLTNLQINELFGTTYTPEELERAVMKIDIRTMKLNQHEVIDDGMDEPSFVDIALRFKARLEFPTVQ